MRLVELDLLDAGAVEKRDARRLGHLGDVAVHGRALDVEGGDELGQRALVLLERREREEELVAVVHRLWRVGVARPHQEVEAELAVGVLLEPVGQADLVA